MQHLCQPRDPGLTQQELAEIAKSAGYLDGEINDVLPHIGDRIFRSARVMISERHTVTWQFFFAEQPDYKDYAALDLVFDELNLRLRSEGEARAQIERSVLVERAIAKHISRQNIEAAITWLLIAKQLTEKDSIIRFGQRGANVRQLPSVTRGNQKLIRPKPDGFLKGFNSSGLICADWPQILRAGPTGRIEWGEPNRPDPLDVYVPYGGGMAAVMTEQASAAAPAAQAAVFAARKTPAVLGLEALAKWPRLSLADRPLNAWPSSSRSPTSGARSARPCSPPPAARA